MLRMGQRRFVFPRYAPPGEPALASRIIDVLRAGGLKAEGDNDRGFDHGVFIPLKLMYPEADVPVVQVQLTLGSTEYLFALYFLMCKALWSSIAL